MKVEGYYSGNRRPPFKEAYFIHDLPIEQRGQILNACFASVLLAELIVAEAYLFSGSESLANFTWFSEVWTHLNSLPAESIRAISLTWPLNSAVNRLNMAVRQLAPTPPPQDVTVSFVVCHCREPLDWLLILRVPRNSSLLLYEKCGVDSTAALSILGVEAKYTGGIHVIPQRDGPVRGDECTAYLHYIQSHYDELPDYTVFLQSDPDHHLFYPYLSTALDGISAGHYTVPFLHLNYHRHYQTTTPCMRDVERLLFNLSQPVEPLPLIGTYCCAQFIVARERILSRPLSFYTHALTLVDGTVPDICSPVPPKRSSHCYVLEYLWHVVFGEDRFLPFRPDDARLPSILRLKYGNEHAKTRWDDVILAKGTGRVVNKTVDDFHSPSSNYSFVPPFVIPPTNVT